MIPSLLFHRKERTYSDILILPQLFSNYYNCLVLVLQLLHIYHSYYYSYNYYYTDYYYTKINTYTNTNTAITTITTTTTTLTTTTTTITATGFLYQDVRYKMVSSNKLTM